MKFGFVLALFVIGLLMAEPAEADAPKATPEQADQLVRMSREFQSCAGFFYALEDLSRETAQVDEGTLLSLHNSGNGAQVAAQWALMLAGALAPQESWDYVKGNVEENRAVWRATIRIDPFQHDQLARCNALGSLQEELVNQAMSWALRNQPESGEKTDGEG